MRTFRVILPIIVFIFIVIVPLYAIADRAFAPSTFGFHLHPLLKATLLFTITQAGLSLGVSLLAGLGLGWFFTRNGSSPRVRGLLLASFSLPSLAIVGLGSVLARKFGYGLLPIVFAHTYLNAPWIALALMDGVSTFPSSWRESARSLGAKPARVAMELVFPWVAARVALASLQVFAFCVMSFTLVLLLGGGPSSGTLETEIYASVRGGGLDLSGAAQFALLQLALAGLPVLLGGMLEVPNADAVDSDSQANRSHDKKSSGWKSILLAALWFSLPLLVLFSAESPLGLVRTLFSLFLNHDFIQAFSATALIAILSATVALGLALLFTFSGWRWVTALGLIPMGLSPLVICLGFLIAYSKGVLEWIDPFQGSIPAIVIIHSILLLPLGIRFLLPVKKDADQKVRKNRRLAARSLGASTFQAWIRAEWPVWRPAISDFARIAWVASFADLAVLSFFGSENLTTVPVLISRWMSRYEFEAATAALFFVTLTASLVLMVGSGERQES